MLTKTEAIVLRSLKYGERKIIVDMFTKKCGRMAFVVKLSSAPNAKFRKQLFQPLTLLTLETDVRPNAQLQSITDLSILVPLPSILSSPIKLSMGMFLSEFLYHALRNEQSDELMFDYVANSLEWLDRCESDYANFHLVFLMHLSPFLGFYPNLDCYQEGCFFDLRSAEFSLNAPVHADVLLPDEASHILLLMRMNYSTMHLFKLNHSERNRILDILVTYYRLHLPSFPEMLSLPVLRELFR